MQFDQVYIYVEDAGVPYIYFKIMYKTPKWHMDTDATQMRMPLYFYSSVLVF